MACDSESLNGEGDVRPEDGERNEGYLVATEASVAQFARQRNAETYAQAVRDFVFEVMATERRAYFPVDPSRLVSQLEGNEGVATGIVRDSEGKPYTVFLTSPQISAGTFTASVEAVASAVLVHVPSDPALAGVAVNPWTDGGILIPTSALLGAIAELGKMFNDEGENK